jgi:hypothetical protein
MSPDMNSPATDTVGRDPARREKLAAIRSVFGDETVQRLAHGRPGSSDGDGDGDGHTTDPQRLAWQRNRLIQHLRQRSQAAQTAPRAADLPTPASAVPASKPEPQTPRVEFDPVPVRPQSVSSLLLAHTDHGSVAGLEGEHPAVIAQILKTQPQERRVAILRALPGRTARAVMSRLRTAAG